jgi:hypothetical protein
MRIVDARVVGCVSPGFIKALIKTTTRTRTKENKQREKERITRKNKEQENN